MQTKKKRKENSNRFYYVCIMTDTLPNKQTLKQKQQHAADHGIFTDLKLISNVHSLW